ncbi:ABC transporter substrate-binding protein [Halobellus clavatus]|jgi:peptide/nickel transport system substrate-binding protein|uniref:Peptide/nickel transport system substrate-binding protein n=1 Tax=Halobellus clavatus TaxID=660517 RepID=A0A1H3I8F9_9EURY|nr:ABC transporter substrate-binding protein [Halobellus clavatus]SDY23224.1 peptide/nickel transport system substrate-binding protein [Halobellus clavatus]
MEYNDISRREILAATGTAIPVGLAGCSDGSDASGDSTDTSSSDSADTGNTAADESGSSEGATFNVGQALQPTRFDPILQYSNPDALVGNRVFSKLYTYTEGTETTTDLATAAPEITRENTRYVVPIKEDVTFHNGDPLTAEDVVYSFLAPIEEETPLSGIFSVIDTATAVDDYTVQFDLNYPFAMFDDLLTHQIVPKAVREDDPEAFNTEQPIGSGPFQFVDWEENSFVELERWDDYWGDTTPNVSGVRFVPITESTTRVTELETGSQDIIETIPPKLWSTVEGMENADVSSVESIGYFYVAFNMNEGPTTDLKVREAIDYSFSMDDAVERFIEPSGLRQYSPMPGPINEDWGFPVDQWTDIPNDKDIEQAQQLFSEADVPSDWNCKIIVPPDDNRENIGVSIANGIKEAGYDANVQRLDWGTMLSQAYTGNADDYNIYVLGWVRYPDPDDFMYNLFHIDAAGVNQGVYYENEEVMTQISEARRSVDQAERKELYTNAITTLLEDKVHLPAFNYKNAYGVSSRVQDFSVHPVSPINPRLVTDYNNVSL